MLNGYTVLPSPPGTARLEAPPPWRYSGEVIGLKRCADLATTNASLLPEFTAARKRA